MIPGANPINTSLTYPSSDITLVTPAQIDALVPPLPDFNINTTLPALPSDSSTNIVTQPSMDPVASQLQGVGQIIQSGAVALGDVASIFVSTNPTTGRVDLSPTISLPTSSSSITTQSQPLFYALIAILVLIILLRGA